jgi:hypothetical protein
MKDSARKAMFAKQAQITKAIDEIISLGKHKTEGEATVQLTPRGKLDVTFYLGNGNFASYGLPYHEAKKTILYNEKFDADSPSFFKKPNSYDYNYKKHVRNTITENQNQLKEERQNPMH